MRWILALAIVTGFGTLAAQKKKSVWDGVYSAEQAKRGSAQLASKCSTCHGAELHGGPGAPGVIGPEFLYNWNGKTAGELFEYVRSQMPPGEAGALSDQRYADIVAAIFAGNEFPAGSAELPPDAGALAEIGILKDKP